MYPMPSSSTKRRKLDFKTFNDLKNDLNLLSQSRYDRAGNWSLGQVCDHIAIFLDKSMDGFNLVLPLPLRMMGGFARWSTLKFRWIPSGYKAPDILLPLDVSSDPQGIERLQKSIQRYESFNQPLHPSPLFGKVSRQQWDQLHLIHAAHHFSFLIPQR